MQDGSSQCVCESGLHYRMAPLTHPQDLMQITEDGALSSSLEVLHHEDTEDRIIYSAAFHPSGPFVAVSQGNECYFYLIHVDESKKKISRLENLCHFQTDFKDADSVQNICLFSLDGQ